MSLENASWTIVALALTHGSQGGDRLAGDPNWGISMADGTTLGKAIRIKGEDHGEEDLVIEGKVEGTISLKENHLTLERSALVTAHAEVKIVTIKGEM